MGNHIKGCSCRRCQSGMHAEGGGSMVQKLIRRVRRAVKRALRRGDEPPPCVSREYTD